MLKPKKNHVHNKELKKQIQQIKQANHTSYEFLEYLKTRFELDLLQDEKFNIKTVQEHLLNMNVVFTEMENKM